MSRKRTNALTTGLERIGRGTAFALRMLRDAFRAPFELAYVVQELVELGERVLSRAIVIEGDAVSEASGDDLTLSLSRASLVRYYLHARFQLETQNIGTVALRAVPPPSTRKNSCNGICIVVLSQSFKASE